jgi:hypothetical protein
MQSKETKLAENAEDVLKEIKEMRKQSIAKKKAERKAAKGLAVDGTGAGNNLDYEALGYEWLVQSADMGNVNALCALGNHFLARANDANCGANEKLDLIKRCIDRYEQAGAQDSTDALYNLGSLYYGGSEIGGQTMFVDYKRSYEYFSKSAELGDVSATFWIGYCHYSGGPAVTADAQGKETLAYSVDMDKALQHFVAASRLQHDQADHYLARLYYDRSYGQAPDRPNLLTAADVRAAAEASSNPTLLFYYYLARSIFIFNDPLAVHFLANLCHDRYFVQNVHLVEERLSLEDRMIAGLVSSYIERCTVMREVGPDGEEIERSSLDESQPRLRQLAVEVPDGEGGGNERLVLNFHLTTKGDMLSVSTTSAAATDLGEHGLWIQTCHQLRVGTMVLLESVANSCSDAALNLGKHCIWMLLCARVNGLSL